MNLGQAICLPSIFNSVSHRLDSTIFTVHPQHLPTYSHAFLGNFLCPSVSRFLQILIPKMSSSNKNQSSTKEYSSASDPKNWVDREVLNIQSTVQYKKLQNIIINAKNLLPNTDSTTVLFRACKTSDRVCMSKSDEKYDFCYFYEAFFTELGLQLPFSDFQVSVLNEINVAPTQLHLDSWAFIRCFELLYASCSLAPSVSTFFFFFEVEEEKNSNISWVKIHARPQRRRILILDHPSRDFVFKDSFFRVERREGSTPFFMNENGKPKFPLYWSKSVRYPASPTRVTFPINFVGLGVPRPCSSLIHSSEDWVSNSDMASEGDLIANYIARDSDYLEDEEIVEQTSMTKRKGSLTPPDVKQMNYADMDRIFESAKLQMETSAELIKKKAERVIKELQLNKKEKDNLEEISRLIAESKKERNGRIKAEEELAKCKGVLLKTQEEVQYLVNEKDMLECDWKSDLSQLVAEFEKEKMRRLEVEEELTRCRGELAKAQKESKYIEGCLVEKWKKSIHESFQNAIDQVCLGLPGLNITSITLDPFKVVKGKGLVDLGDSII
ncbi:unnamed protein product [Lupinus luteus]|uniref:Uncharacterized protein n=1 Tax=Lupinus luteus TaxID=3873 RepID=A0AAV1XDF3_LUPLU